MILINDTYECYKITMNLLHILKGIPNNPPYWTYNSFYRNRYIYYHIA